jgi:hypothetical protein
MPAPKGNKNAAGRRNAAGNTNPRLGKKGKACIMSLPYTEWEAFKSACMAREGALMSDGQCIEAWRCIDRMALQAFVDAAHHGRNEQH